MATLSAIFQISCLLHLGHKGGRGAGVGSGVTSWDNTALSLFSFANTHLEWCEQPE